LKQCLHSAYLKALDYKVSTHKHKNLACLSDDMGKIKEHMGKIKVIGQCRLESEMS